MRTAIYGLIDPRTSCLMYVGKTTKSLAVRLDSHLRDVRSARQRRCKRVKWLRDLDQIGLKPSIELLDEEIGDGCALECYWIASLRSAGAILANMTDGGEGAPGVKYKFKNLKESHRNKIGDALRGRSPSPESIAKRVVTLTGRKLSAEHIESIRRSRAGLVVSDAAKKAMSIAQQALAKKPEGRARLAKAWIARKNNALQRRESQAMQDRHQHILDLRRLGLLQEEIASIMNLSGATVCRTLKMDKNEQRTT